MLLVSLSCTLSNIATTTQTKMSKIRNHRPLKPSYVVSLAYMPNCHKGKFCKLYSVIIYSTDFILRCNRSMSCSFIQDYNPRNEKTKWKRRLAQQWDKNKITAAMAARDTFFIIRLNFIILTEYLRQYGKSSRI